MKGLALYKLMRIPIHVEFGVVWFAFGGYKVGLIGSGVLDQVPFVDGPGLWG